MKCKNCGHRISYVKVNEYCTMWKHGTKKSWVTHPTNGCGVASDCDCLKPTPMEKETKQ